MLLRRRWLRQRENENDEPGGDYSTKNRGGGGRTSAAT
jgi:hypothetical protein